MEYTQWGLRRFDVAPIACVALKQAEALRDAFENDDRDYARGIFLIFGEVGHLGRYVVVETVTFRALWDAGTRLKTLGA